MANTIKTFDVTSSENESTLVLIPGTRYTTEADGFQGQWSVVGVVAGANGQLVQVGRTNPKSGKPEVIAIKVDTLAQHFQLVPGSVPKLATEVVKKARKDNQALRLACALFVAGKSIISATSFAQVREYELASWIAEKLPKMTKEGQKVSKGRFRNFMWVLPSDEALTLERMGDKGLAELCEEIRVIERLEELTDEMQQKLCSARLDKIKSQVGTVPSEALDKAYIIVDLINKGEWKANVDYANSIGQRDE